MAKKDYHENGEDDEERKKGKRPEPAPITVDELQKLMEKFEKLKEENEELKEENERLRKENEKLSKELMNLRNEIENLNKEIKRLGELEKKKTKSKEVKEHKRKPKEKIEFSEILLTYEDTGDYSKEYLREVFNLLENTKTKLVELEIDDELFKELSKILNEIYKNYTTESSKEDKYRSIKYLESVIREIEGKIGDKNKIRKVKGILEEFKINLTEKYINELKRMNEEPKAEEEKEEEKGEDKVKKEEVKLAYSDLAKILDEEISKRIESGEISKEDAEKLIPIADLLREMDQVYRKLEDSTEEAPEKVEAEVEKREEEVKEKKVEEEVEEKEARVEKNEMKKKLKISMEASGIQYLMPEIAEKIAVKTNIELPTEEEVIRDFAKLLLAKEKVKYSLFGIERLAKKISSQEVTELSDIEDLRKKLDKTISENKAYSIVFPLMKVFNPQIEEDVLILAREELIKAKFEAFLRHEIQRKGAQGLLEAIYKVAGEVNSNKVGGKMHRFKQWMKSWKGILTRAGLGFAFALMAGAATGFVAPGIALAGVIGLASLRFLGSYITSEAIIHGIGKAIIERKVTNNIEKLTSTAVRRALNGNTSPLKSEEARAMVLSFNSADLTKLVKKLVEAMAKGAESEKKAKPIKVTLSVALAGVLWATIPRLVNIIWHHVEGFLPGGASEVVPSEQISQTTTAHETIAGNLQESVPSDTTHATAHVSTTPESVEPSPTVESIAETVNPEPTIEATVNNLMKNPITEAVDGEKITTVWRYSELLLKNSLGDEAYRKLLELDNDNLTLKAAVDAIKDRLVEDLAKDGLVQAEGWHELLPKAEKVPLNNVIDEETKNKLVELFSSLKKVLSQNNLPKGELKKVVWKGISAFAKGK